MSPVNLLLMLPNTKQPFQIINIKQIPHMKNILAIFQVIALELYIALNPQEERRTDIALDFSKIFQKFIITLKLGNILSKIIYVFRKFS